MRARSERIEGERKGEIRRVVKYLGTALLIQVVSGIAIAKLEKAYFEGEEE